MGGVVKSEPGVAADVPPGVAQNESRSSEAPSHQAQTSPPSAQTMKSAVFNPSAGLQRGAGAVKASSERFSTSSRAHHPTSAPSFLPLSASSLPALRARTLDWYDSHHRILPWRVIPPTSKVGKEALAAAAAQGVHPPPPSTPLNEALYRVWICEVMSQQTQVSRVADRWAQWSRRWPTVADLAQAGQEEVNEVWAGLGYYRRARLILQGAQHIAKERGGQMPRTAAELETLPGVGPYTAAAIASNACDQRVAVVDGNVVRVLSRMAALRAPGSEGAEEDGEERKKGRSGGGEVGGTGSGGRSPSPFSHDLVAELRAEGFETSSRKPAPGTAAHARLLKDLAEALIDPGRPGDWNQAIMELGATVCLPNAQPLCGACPLAQNCLALALERQGRGTRATDFPAPAVKKARREVAVVAAVVRWRPLPSCAGGGAARPLAQLLVAQRPADGLLGGLWEFPLVEVGEESIKEDDQNAGDDSNLPDVASLPRRPGSKFSSRQNEDGDEASAMKRPKTEARGGAMDMRAVMLAYLHKLAPTAFGAVQSSGLRALGEIVHIFSHIRMTLHVFTVDIQTAELPELAPLSDRAPLSKWVPEKSFEPQQYSSSVRKVYALFDKDGRKSKQSIARFFSRS